MRRLPTKYRLLRSTSELTVSLYDGEGNQSDTIHRSKAVGEPPLMLGISAFSAISDAIRDALNQQFPKIRCTGHCRANFNDNSRA